MDKFRITRKEQSKWWRSVKVGGRWKKSRLSIMSAAIIARDYSLLRLLTGIFSAAKILIGATALKVTKAQVSRFGLPADSA